jgi:hypothetical protein
MSTTRRCRSGVSEDARADRLPRRLTRGPDPDVKERELVVEGMRNMRDTGEGAPIRPPAIEPRRGGKQLGSLKDLGYRPGGTLQRVRDGAGSGDEGHAENPRSLSGHRNANGHSANQTLRQRRRTRSPARPGMYRRSSGGSTRSSARSRSSCELRSEPSRVRAEATALAAGFDCGHAENGS